MAGLESKCSAAYTRVYSKQSRLVYPYILQSCSRETPVDSRTTMSGEAVCQVARSWVDVDSFHTRLLVSFMNFTGSVQNIFDTTS
jgi:hypothetical protein